MITKTTITVDSVNRLPHGTVRRAPEGFAHAILLDQNSQDTKWLIVDLYGPVETDHDVEVADWPVVYVPAPDKIWEIVNFRLPRDPEDDGPSDQHGALFAIEEIDSQQ